MTSQATYRVVGVRHRGERINLADGLTLDRGEHIQQVLSDLIAFQELIVEAESGASDAPALWHV